VSNTTTHTDTLTTVARAVTTPIATDGTTIAIGSTAGIMDRITTDITTIIPTTTDGAIIHPATEDTSGITCCDVSAQVTFEHANKITRLKPTCRKRLIFRFLCYFKTIHSK